jgi:lysophospholipase L1-like esterase
MANAFRILTLGDSVQWGQGLLETEKYDSMVKDALGPTFPGGVTLQRLAHSGAVIGVNLVGGNPANGEVPVPGPTIIEQCDSFADSPDTVDLVLLNGGINDVGIATILNPFDLVPPLSSKITAACHDGMLVLLNKVSAKFTKPTCKILVTGYFTILSDQSDPLGVHRLLSLHGIAAPDFIEDAAILDPVFDRCETFFNESTAQLQRAIANANDPRIVFVPSGFTDNNAVFAGTPLLFGLDDQLNPEDPVAAQRHVQCDIAHNQPLDLPARELCYRASAGHPNPAGAMQYKQQILAVL